MGSGGSKHKLQGSRTAHQTAADRPLPPGKPYLLPGSPRADPDIITIKWAPPIYNGGTKITGYLVEHKRTGSPHWVKATPLMVRHTQLSLSGLEPGMRYQFRVSAENCVGRSEPGQVSEPFAISYLKGVAVAPVFIRTLVDTSAIENEKVEFLVQVEGTPIPKIAWFKDGFEVFSNRRQRVSTDGDFSSFVIHQASLSDEGEIKCSATNKAGHAVAKSRLTLEAPPSIRLPRQYEDGLLFEIGEVVRFKISVTGRPNPTISWYHNGDLLLPSHRVELAATERYAMVRISDARREDRGEYQVKAKNSIGDDVASFLVTITDRPLPPGKIAVVMTLGRCVTLSWDAPEDDGGCKIGNYIVEYYRIGWNMWLKAATCRQLTTTIGDLIEGSEYKFRVKAENPYGISDPSEESDIIFIPDPKRGLLEPPARGGQMLLDETPEKWLESRKSQTEQISKMTKKQNQLTKLNKQNDWANEDEESPLPSPVVLANQVLRKVKMAPKRGWSDESQPSFEEPEKILPPIPPKRRHRHPVVTSEKPNIKPPKESRNNKSESMKQWEARELSPPYSPNGEELHSSSEMMLVLVPNSRAMTEERDEELVRTEDLDKEQIVAPPMSLSAPELSSCEPVTASSLRPSVSSSELMYELALARIYKEVDQEETEEEVKKKYGIERRRSFEKRSPRTREFLNSIKEQSISLENIVNKTQEQGKDGVENIFNKSIEEEEELEIEVKDFEKSQKDEFSERFMQLEKSFKDYSAKYEFENNPSDIESIDRMSLDYSDEIEEDTYHPRIPKGTFTPITIQLSETQNLPPPELQKAPVVMQSEISEDNDEENFSITIRNDQFTRSNTPSPEPSSPIVSNSSPRISPLPTTSEQCRTLTPKPILKLRDRSVDRGDISESEHSHQKKVRIEAPDDKEDIDVIAREENVIGLSAGEVARNRRMKSQQLQQQQQQQRQEEAAKDDAYTVVISHYSDIVREYGQAKRTQTKLYLNYDELKAAAEKTELNPPVDKTIAQINEIAKPDEIIENKPVDSEEKSNLLTIEKKPNLYREYILNLLLFIVASWLYLFNDPLLVIPILILMMYRQLYETLNKKIEYFLRKKK